jgi:alkyl sulfatase BDS1-like metallo-beta-lactamase superfamily hydrolase
MSEQPRKTPLLAQIIRSGSSQTEATVITDFVYCAKDVSNAYVVNTADGHVMINAGFVPSVERNKSLFAPVANGEIQAIFLTQAHPDHYGGVPAFAKTNTPIIAQQEFSNTFQYFKMLDEYLKRRSGVIWTNTIEKREELIIPTVVPTETFRDKQEYVFGNRRFIAISTPGGEAPDASVIWLPDDEIVFTGNLFGPLLDSVPNLCTTRGDKPRSAARYLKGIQTVIDLKPNILLAGHSAAIYGKDNVSAMLTKMRDAVQYIHDETVKGMNAGKSVHELMQEIKLPAAIKIQELHGKVNWAVKTIWEEYSGWFHMDSTASLYGVPQKEIHNDLVELAGADQLAARAKQKLSQQKPLEAIHLSDIVLNSYTNHRGALEARLGALDALLDLAGGENMSEIMWLNSQVRATTSALWALDKGNENDK